jgi:prolyl-tRNA synthetase
MTHGDDAGLVVPPKLAAVQIVIVPIYRSDDERSLVLDKATQVSRALTDAGVRVHVDMRDTMKPGPKFYEWERKGVPFRIEIGPKDVAKEQLTLVARIAGAPDAPRKEMIGDASAASELPARLEAYQRALLQAAIDRRERNSHRNVADYDGFRQLLDGDGGFVYAGWCGSAQCEARVKEDTKATARVIPSEEFRSPTAPSRCLVCGERATHEVVWARAY